MGLGQCVEKTYHTSPEVRLNSSDFWYESKITSYFFNQTEIYFLLLSKASLLKLRSPKSETWPLMCLALGLIPVARCDRSLGE